MCYSERPKPGPRKGFGSVHAAALVPMDRLLRSPPMRIMQRTDDDEFFQEMMDETLRERATARLNEGNRGVLERACGEFQMSSPSPAARSSMDDSPTMRRFAMHRDSSRSRKHSIDGSDMQPPPKRRYSPRKTNAAGSLWADNRQSCWM